MSILNKLASTVGKATRSFSDSAFGPGLTQDDIRRTMNDSAEKQKQYMDLARQQREQDMAAGKARGQELFGNKALGRVEEQRSQEVGNIIGRRQQESQGYTPQEQEAFRAQQLPNLQRDLASQQRQLKMQQASSGVFGPAALAQQKALQAGSQQAKAGMERQLFLDNILARREGLNSLEGSIAKARADELARQESNLSRQGKETFGQLGTELGFAGLGSQERAGAAQQALGETSALLGASKGKK